MLSWNQCVSDLCSESNCFFFEKYWQPNHCNNKELKEPLIVIVDMPSMHNEMVVFKKRLHNVEACMEFEKEKLEARIDYEKEQLEARLDAFANAIVEVVQSEVNNSGAA